MFTKISRYCILKVICLSETWLHDAKHAASFNLSNYQLISLHQHNSRAGGGVCIFVQAL